MSETNAMKSLASRWSGAFQRWVLLPSQSAFALVPLTPCGMVVPPPGLLFIDCLSGMAVQTSLRSPFAPHPASVIMFRKLHIMTPAQPPAAELP